MIWAALFLSMNLSMVSLSYAMESKDAPEAETELSFDMTGLLWSSLLAFIGLCLDPELTAESPQP